MSTPNTSFTKSRMRTFIVLIALVVTVFFGFILFRGYMVSAGVYDPYVSWCDVNYHMGNSYVLFIESNDFVCITLKFFFEWCNLRQKYQERSINIFLF